MTALMTQISHVDADTAFDALFGGLKSDAKASEGKPSPTFAGQARP